MSTSQAPKMPIIAFAPQPWKDPQWMNRQHIMSRLGKRGWPVLYSSGPLDVWERAASKWTASPWYSTYEYRDNVWVDCPGRLVPRWSRFPQWDRAILRHHATRHSQWMRRQCQNPETILFLFHPRFWPYVEILQPKYVVFHVYDVFSRQPGWTEELDKMQTKLLGRADLVTFAGPDMPPRFCLDAVSNWKILANGADCTAFGAGVSTPQPRDIMNIPEPRICYAGSLNRKVNFNIIAAIGETRPDWHWMLIGGIHDRDILGDEALRAAFLRCRELPNIHFLGEIESALVPSYVGHANANVMCYRDDGEGWWHYGYPLKLHEYLATGLPVIGTPLPCMLGFSDVVDLPQGEQEWVIAIQRALTQGGVGTPKERQYRAALNSWDQRVDQLQAWLRALSFAPSNKLGGSQQN